jgi:hypothetical protein
MRIKKMASEIRGEKTRTNSKGATAELHGA